MVRRSDVPVFAYGFGTTLPAWKSHTDVKPSERTASMCAMCSFISRVTASGCNNEIKLRSKVHTPVLCVCVCVCSPDKLFNKHPAAGVGGSDKGSRINAVQ